MFKKGLHENKEQQGSGPGWSLVFLLLLGGVIVLGGGLLAAWPVIAQQAPRATPIGTTTARPSGFPTPPVPLSSTYYKTVEQQVAQGLHLTVAQVKTKLQAVGDLFYVARDQGIPDDQVQNRVITLEINALQTATQRMVDTGVWTQQQANENMQFWRQLGPKLVTQEISQWFRDY